MGGSAPRHARVSIVYTVDRSRWRLWLVATLLNAIAAWGADDPQRPAQPSANAPSLPDYPRSGPPEGFILPKVAENPAVDRVSDETFAIQQVVVDNNTLIPPEEIRALVAPLEHRTVSLNEIETLRQAVTRRCIDRGYLNSGATIPKNGFEQGILRLRIDTGHLDDVRVDGQERLRAGYIQNRLRPDAEEPLHLPSVQERFQLLLADPLIAKLNGRIVPGTRPGHAILDVAVTRARPYQLSVFGDNYRPPSIGAEVFGVTGWVRNLTGFGDTLDFTFTTGAGSERYSGGWRLPINDLGTEAFFRFDEGASSVIEEPVRELNIKSAVHVLEGGVMHPLLLSLKERLGVGLMFSVRKNATEIAGLPFPAYAGDDSGRSQVTVLRLNQEYLRRWEADVVSLRSTFSIGLDALGASQRRLPFGPGGEFFAWLGQAQYAHRLTDNGLQAVVRGTVQLSDAPLLPLEQIAVGGVGSVRGYRENQLVRDEGFFLSAELHIPVFQGDNASERLILVPFVDHGQAANRGERLQSLTSIGVGFNADYHQVHAELYYGYGFDRPARPTDPDLQDHGIHFQGRIDAF